MSAFTEPIFWMGFACGAVFGFGLCAVIINLIIK